MGLRSLVALPVDKGGSVLRFSLQSAEESEIDSFLTNAAYGISTEQTLLFGLSEVASKRPDVDEIDVLGLLALFQDHRSLRIGNPRRAKGELLDLAVREMRQDLELSKAVEGLHHATIV